MGETLTEAEYFAAAYRDARRAEDANRTRSRTNVVTLSELRPYAERYAAMEFGPLVVVAETGNSPVVSYDLLHLDSLLSYVVMIEATQGFGPGEDDFIFYCPLPLARLWSSPNDLPLWTASDFFPVAESAKSTVIYHQRFLTPTRTGRFMDKRIPKPVVIADTWQARCYGDAREIERLLNLVTGIGKHRHDGMGHVKEWRVERGDFAPVDTLVSDGMLTRPILEMAAGTLGVALEGSPSLVGWTPPYWKRQLFNYGWRTGTQVHRNVDYFEDVPQQNYGKIDVAL